jgi:hypothetical protein
LPAIKRRLRKSSPPRKGLAGNDHIGYSGHQRRFFQTDECYRMLIQQQGYWVVENEIHEGRFPVCDTPITGVWVEGLP